MALIKRGVVICSFLSYGYAFLYHKDADGMRKTAYDKGRSVSQSCKPYGFWDNLVEPFVIRQFGFFLGIGHSFIKGMISDNVIKIDDQLDQTINDFISKEKEKNEK